MAVQNVAKNLAADAVASQVDFLSLHTTDGSTTGANQLTGGTYARVAPTYASASSGTASLSVNAVFNGPGSAATVTHLGFWGGTAGDTWLGSIALTEPKSLGPGDTLTVTAANIVVL